MLSLSTPSVSASQAAPLLPPRAAAPTFFQCTSDDLQRAEVESFIQDVYARRFGARVRQFMPVLVGLRDEAGIVAAAGYRDAGDSPLFLERYLQAPVETLLGRFQGSQPERRAVVEVGHLAAARAGEGRRLILQLGPYLAQMEFQWVVSTLTEELRKLFVRIGISPLSLGCADPEALEGEAAEWGTYYDHRPLVLAGYVPQVLRSLRTRSSGAGL